MGLDKSGTRGSVGYLPLVVVVFFITAVGVDVVVVVVAALFVDVFVVFAVEISECGAG